MMTAHAVSLSLRQAAIIIRWKKLHVAIALDVPRSIVPHDPDVATNRSVDCVSVASSFAVLILNTNCIAATPNV
jgi:hypothetical protein